MVNPQANPMAANPAAAPPQAVNPVPVPGPAPVVAQAAAPVNPAYVGSMPVPQYDVPVAGSSPGEGKAIAALVLSVLSIPGALLVITGLIFGILGLVFGTLSRKSTKKGLAISGIIISIIGILLSMAMWAFDISVYNKDHSTSNNTPTSQLVSVSTPCYTTKVDKGMTVTTEGNSCAISAASADKSNVYEISSGASTELNSGNLGTIGKELIVKGIEAISNYKLTSSSVGTFAGSPAYIANLTYSTTGYTAQEDLVLHSTPDGSTYFVLIHLNELGNADLSVLDNNWVWK